MTSLYIAVEGPDLVGKSTWIRALASLLRNHREVLFIREPGGPGVCGMVLREYLLTKERRLADQLDLLLGDRIITQAFYIKPALKREVLVISDRSCISAMVYQGWMNHQFEAIKKAHEEIDGFLFPDIVVNCYAPIEVVFDRLEKRRMEKVDINYLDEKDKDFQIRVAQHFEQMEQWWDKSKILKLNLNCPVEDSIQNFFSLLKSQFDIELY